MKFSNFSKPGFESRHNLMYWDNAEYYGLGAGVDPAYVDGIRYKTWPHLLTICRLSKRKKMRKSPRRKYLTQTEMMEEEISSGTTAKVRRFQEAFLKRSFGEF